MAQHGGSKTISIALTFMPNYSTTMFKLAALSALVAGAAAFAPAQQGASSTALASAFENEVSPSSARL